jgi:dihydrofolate synthase / folylpolyglutamate synthase
MTYREARAFIESSSQYGSKLGLDTITELLRRMGNPQDKLKLIHIAGTNGKGSTAAYISSILTKAGYCTGRYISPSVFSYREKIQIGTEYITEQGLADAINIIKPICEAMLSEGLDHPTSFEIETAMAFLYFDREQVDFAVIETGLGGRLDATNVIHKPLLCVITSISMDHMQYLGDTLEQITGEKAGIIKPGVPVITANTEPSIIRVLRQACSENNTALQEIAGQITNIRTTTEGTRFCYQTQEYEVGLLGKYQAGNATLAISAAESLRGIGYAISDSCIRNGLLSAKWSGRLEVIAKEPYFILDGAHNEDAAIQLHNTLTTLFPHQRKIFIMGVLADKEYKKILEITAPLADIIITVTPDNSRALSSSLLAAEAVHFTNAKVIHAESICKAVDCAYEHARKEDVILAFGSLSYLGDIRECLSE